MAKVHRTQRESGKKFRTEQGFSAIRNGVKTVGSPHPGAAKPDWLRVRIKNDDKSRSVTNTVRKHRLATVCEESYCPNISECWNHGTATIMLMGAVCTRSCRFCAVDTGNPRGWLDPDEPLGVANSVHMMNLKYVVLTSVDRDDLPEGGADHIAACIREVRTMNPNTAVEALTPDFSGSHDAVETVVNSGLQVFAQNLETVERLTKHVRDPRAGYSQTLKVLCHAKFVAPQVLTKSSLMLGLGERDDEIKDAMDDLRSHAVDILTLGQYLRPTPNHLPVQRWVHPEEFERYRRWGIERGFAEVAAGPLVRSSYRADRVLGKLGFGFQGM